MSIRSHKETSPVQLKGSTDVCGCCVPDEDSDGDGVLDCEGACPTEFGIEPDGCNLK